jgi:hydroxymethylglutaryl-CoA lyase
MRNTHKTIADSVVLLQEILELAHQHNKKVVAYLSMGFGNPYGDPWNLEIVGEWTAKLYQMGVEIISLSDTVGSSTPEVIQHLFSNLIPLYPKVEFGAHLHTTKSTWHEKIHAAYTSGCRRFDGAIQGFGGCPMAKDSLTGNMPMEKIISYLNTQKVANDIRMGSFEAAYNKASDIFNNYH